MKRGIQVKTGKEYGKVWEFDKNILIEILPQLKNSFEKTESRLIYKFVDTEVDLSLEVIDKLSSNFNSVIIGTDGLIIEITLAYEEWNNNDVSFLPSFLLFSAEKEIKEWIKTETEKQLKQQELDKTQEKEDIKRQIELLQKRLEN